MLKIIILILAALVLFKVIKNVFKVAIWVGILGGILYFFNIF